MVIEKHMNAIRSGFVTKTNIIGIRKALNVGRRISYGYSVSATAPKMTALLVNAPEMCVEHYHPTVIGDMHDSGLKVLRNKRYRNRGEPTQEEIIADLHHFELVRFDYIGHRDMYSVPIFRAVDSRGRSFIFRNIPWQSGGNGPETTWEVF